MAEGRFCPECGEGTEGSARFCRSCGAELIEDGAQDARFHGTAVESGKGEPGGRGRTRGLVAAGAGLLALVAVAVVLVTGAFSGDDGGSGSSGGEVPLSEIQARVDEEADQQGSFFDEPGAESGTEAPGQQAEAIAPQQQEEAAPKPTGSTTVETSLYSVRIPGGWSTEKIDERNSTRYTSEWRDPGSTGVSVLIDALAPAPAGSAFDNAVAVRSETQQTPGYSEISFREARIGGSPGAEWVFDVPDGRRIDYLFNRCDVGVAVLGAAPPSSFGALRPTFREIAASVDPGC